MRGYIETSRENRQRSEGAITLVSHRHRFIFLRTHKTGSTSVEAALEPLCLPPGAPVGGHYRDMEVSDAGIVGARGGAYRDREWTPHMGAMRIRAKLGRSMWRSYTKIAVVRNPYDRMVSMFWWRLNDQDRRLLSSAPFETVREAFSSWLARTDGGKNIGKLCIGPRYCLNLVLYYEHLETDILALFERFGHPPPVLPRYKSGARLRDEPWRAYYDDASRRIIRHQSGFELAFFGYDLDGGPYPQSKAQRARRLMRLNPVRITNALRQPRSPAEIALDPLDHSGRPA